MPPRVECSRLDLSDNALQGVLPEALSHLLPDHGGSLRSFHATPGGLNVSHNCAAVPRVSGFVSACANQTFTDDDECGADDCFHHVPRVELVCALTPQRTSGC